MSDIEKEALETIRQEKIAKFNEEFKNPALIPTTIVENNKENISNTNDIISLHDTEESSASNKSDNKLDDNEVLTPELMEDLKRNVAYLNEMILKEELN